jgi:hypothetical protein
MFRTHWKLGRRELSAWVFGLGLMIAAVAGLRAQETVGAIEGVVKDSSGAVLPGANVEATGPVGVLRGVSDDQGKFRFPRVPSGRYKVTASLSGFATRESPVEVTVGNTSRVEFDLAVSGVAEAVQVTASAVIDMTSAATSTSISRERIELLPRGREFTDVVAQAPGANPETQGGGISIDGSSGSENRFVIDGIDTTSPQVGTNSVPMRADFFEEVQVKSAGYAAEFGGSTGGVINAVTKSGSNRYSGMVLSEFQERKWGGDERPLLRDSLTSTTFTFINPPKEDETRIDPGFQIGGPIIRDRLFFFGAYQPGIRDTKRTVNFSNGVTNTFDQDYRVDFGAFNVNGNALGSKLLYKAGGNISQFEEKRDLPGKDGRTSLTSAQDWLRGDKSPRSTYSGQVDYVPNDKMVISGRVGRFYENPESTNVAYPGLIHNFSTSSTVPGIAALPDAFRRQPGFVSDVLITDATTRDEYIRDSVWLDASYFLRGFGEHQIKGGLQTERISNDVLSGQNADRILYYAGRPYFTSTGQVVQGTFGYFRLLNDSTFGKVASRNTALYIQDTWRVNSRLTLNLGLRTEDEKIPNFGTTGISSPIHFGYGEKLAPRLGFTFDPVGDLKWKIYGSYGRYYDVMKYELPRGSFGGDRWVDYFYSWDNANWGMNGSGCATGTNTIAERPVCAAGTFIEPLDRRHNAAENPDDYIDPNLKPMSSNEYQIGVTRELKNSMVVGARYVRKDLIRTIEDVGVLVPGVGEVFYIANPGEGITLSLADPGVPNFPKPEREYQALELTFGRRLANNWSLFATYTFSRLFGNYSGLASSDEDGRTAPNVNRFFDHIENTFDRNGDLVFGRLGTDRPHYFKTQFIYQLKSNTTLGVNQRIFSGIPVSEEANVTASQIPFFPYGRDNLDRTDVVSQTDLQVGQSFRFSRYTVNFDLIVLNLFDQDAVTRRYNNRTVGQLPLTTAQFFAGGWDYEAILAANPNILDVKFNQPDQWQAPREVRISIRFGF